MYPKHDSYVINELAKSISYKQLIQKTGSRKVCQISASDFNIYLSTIISWIVITYIKSVSYKCNKKLDDFFRKK